MALIEDIPTEEDAKGASRTWTGIQLLVVMLCFLINMVDGMDVLILSYIAPLLGDEWGLSSGALGIVFSAGLAGMAIGGILIAPLADRLGRRKLILIALLLMTGGMIGSGFAGGVISLTLARVLVGIGIGTALACMAAITAEYAPPFYRNFAVGSLQAGYPIGATLTGFVAASLLPSHGWRFLLIGAGCVSALLVPLVFRYMPESVAFLKKARLADRDKTAALPKIAVSALFANGRFIPTLLLWVAVFSGFMVLYFIVSWIPRLAIAAGLDGPDSIYAASIYNIGAFSGTVGLSWLATHVRLQPIICVSMLFTAIILLIFGGVAMPVFWVMVTAFLLGIALQGGFNGLYPLAAQLYPVEIRSTGIGWAMGLGRAGAVIGPLLGGYVLGLESARIVLFAIFAAPAVIVGFCALRIRTDETVP